MNLSTRLLTLRSFHHEGESIWDIGCDHGQLGLSFLSNSEIKTINLIDPSILVIESLNKHLKDSYITIPALVKVIHKKGQDITLTPERKTIFIAGMGGKEILEIIHHLHPQMGEHDRLVISPHKNLLQVREWLHTSPLRLHTENVVLDEGRFYPILVLELNKALPLVSLHGEGLWKSEVGKAYLKHEISTFSRHKDKMSSDYIAYLSTMLLN